MPSIIPVPSTAADVFNVSLGLNTYDFKFRFNSKDSRWYFDIYNSDSTALKLGVKVMENQSLLARYKLDNFEGDIICFRKSNTLAPVGFDNLGVGLDYELIYYTQAEIDEVFSD